MVSDRKRAALYAPLPVREPPPFRRHTDWLISYDDGETVQRVYDGVVVKRAATGLAKRLKDDARREALRKVVWPARSGKGVCHADR